MDEQTYDVIIPDYLDKPLTEEEEKEFFSDLEEENLNDENLNLSDFVSKDEFEKLYDEYLYQKSINEYNQLTMENNERTENFLNQIANCSLFTLGFVGFFVIIYLLTLVIKFFKSILDF